MKQHKRRGDPQADVDEFNRMVPVGSRVSVSLDSGGTRDTTTRSEAWVLGGHSPVVQVEGIAGCYLITRITPLGKGGAS